MNLYFYKKKIIGESKSSSGDPRWVGYRAR